MEKAAVIRIRYPAPSPLSAQHVHLFGAYEVWGVSQWDLRDLRELGDLGWVISPCWTLRSSVFEQFWASRWAGHQWTWTNWNHIHTFANNLDNLGHLHVSASSKRNTWLHTLLLGFVVLPAVSAVVLILSQVNKTPSTLGSPSSLVCTCVRVQYLYIAFFANTFASHKLSFIFPVWDDVILS